MIAEIIVDVATSETDRIFDYLCDDTLAEGSRVLVPFGGRATAGFVVALKEKSDYPAEKLKKAVAADPVPALNKECLILAKKIAARYACPLAAALRLFLPSEMRKGKVRELLKRYAALCVPYDTLSFPKSAKNQIAVAAFLHEHGKSECAALNAAYPGSVAALQKKGYIEITEEQVLRDPYKTLGESGTAHTLTEDQKRAVLSVQSDKRTVQLLHGVTGSGKTEIYLTLIADCLKHGKSAIFLVPEISLTPQMLAQLRARFGKNAAIMHSGLSAGEKFDEWWRLRSGEAKIAVGARSAVFAPLENLGVIVIDEEHDSSYSSETAPRYNTFDIALLRAKYNDCKLVLGSATPSVETYKRAKEGEFNLIPLLKRVNKKPMPEIIIADMRKEARRGNNTSFSFALQSEIEECLAKGNQAILFLNRRGYSQTVICRDCGYVAKCESCDVSLTYHKEEDCLKCHYCGAKYKMLRGCPECGGTHLTYAGTGTQRVEAEIKKRFPGARVLRMDNDTTSGKEGHFKILKEFGEHRADILVGTQMIAKGHDFRRYAGGNPRRGYEPAFFRLPKRRKNVPTRHAGGGAQRQGGRKGKSGVADVRSRKRSVEIRRRVRLRRVLRKRNFPSRGKFVSALFKNRPRAGFGRKRQKDGGNAARGVRRAFRAARKRTGSVFVFQSHAFARRQNSE